MANIDGVAKQGKTEGQNPKHDGPKVGLYRGKNKAGGVTTEKMKAVGRGLAKVAFQTGGK